MEDLVKMNFVEFWKNRRVLITGHTGFKGSWMTLYLSSLGAKVAGYSLESPTSPSLFALASVEKHLEFHEIGDVRNLESLQKAVNTYQPEIMIHMAAQPLVRDSYKMPVETYSVNVMGTVNFLEAVRFCDSVKAVVNVTTDKVYENREWVWSYRENDRLGGYDPYSNSKACSELVTASYISSYFHPKNYSEHGKAIASARAGNVIGGGDFAVDRLVPDIIRSYKNKNDIVIRNPEAIRPWQHVLEPVTGYLLLAKHLFEDGATFGGAWNFGPVESGFKTVGWVVAEMKSLWDNKLNVIMKGEGPHEASILKLDCIKSSELLNWRRNMDISEALDSVVKWTDAWISGAKMEEVTLKQIDNYIKRIRV